MMLYYINCLIIDTISTIINYYNYSEFDQILTVASDEADAIKSPVGDIAKSLTFDLCPKSFLGLKLFKRSQTIIELS
jgi:hypothetical protein